MWSTTAAETEAAAEAANAKLAAVGNTLDTRAVGHNSNKPNIRTSTATATKSAMMSSGNKSCSSSESSVRLPPPRPGKANKLRQQVRQNDSLVSKMRKEMNEMTVRHREEVYWLRLELDTSRREKEAVEDRMAELYRDLQEMEESIGVQQTRRSRPAAAPTDAAYVAELQTKVEKYERMVRVMNNQIALVRSSSDNVVKSLKEEISDLMDDKARTEMELMNQIADLDKEKRELELEQQQQQKEQEQQQMLDASSSTLGAAARGPQQPQTRTLVRSRSASPPPSARAHGKSNGVIVSAKMVHQKFHADIKKLTDEKNKLTKELHDEKVKIRQNKEEWKRERQELKANAEKLQGDLLVLRSTADAVQTLGMVKANREEAVATLERVASIWDQADQSIQSTESIMAQLKPKHHHLHNGGHDDHSLFQEDRERFLSTLETASLVHGQVKVSLMLIELTLRNNLACLRNDFGQFHQPESASWDSDMKERFDGIQIETMAAIEQVAASVSKQMEQLEEKSLSETKLVKQQLQDKLDELKRFKTRQESLDKQIGHLRHSGNSSTCSAGAATTNTYLNHHRGPKRRGLSQRHSVGGGTASAAAGSMNSIRGVGSAGVGGNSDDESSSVNSTELFVSRKVLERLQREVLQVVERVKEKNEKIGRLEAVNEELKVREQSLMNELKRLRDDGAKQEERNMLVAQLKAQLAEGDEVLMDSLNSKDTNDEGVNDNGDDNKEEGDDNEDGSSVPFGSVSFQAGKVAGDDPRETSEHQEGGDESPSEYIEEIVEDSVTFEEEEDTSFIEETVA